MSAQCSAFMGHLIPTPQPLVLPIPETFPVWRFCWLGWLLLSVSLCGHLAFTLFACLSQLWPFTCFPHVHIVAGGFRWLPLSSEMEFVFLFLVSPIVLWCFQMGCGETEKSIYKLLKPEVYNCLNTIMIRVPKRYFMRDFNSGTCQGLATWVRRKKGPWRKSILATHEANWSVGHIDHFLWDLEDFARHFIFKIRYLKPYEDVNFLKIYWFIFRESA